MLSNPFGWTPAFWVFDVAFLFMFIAFFCVLLYFFFYILHGLVEIAIYAVGQLRRR